MSSTLRHVESLHSASAASDGAGVRLFRNIAPRLQQRLDPFLLLDEFRSDDPNDYIGGFPDHPHRGFETVTYMLEGAMRHRDSTGSEGVLRSGGVQWMKAGRGVIHSELPEQVGGLLQGFQLWINLPSGEKMDAPRYEEFARVAIPTTQPAEGVLARVIAGTVAGVTGPIAARRTRPLYVDLEFTAGARLTQPIEPGAASFVYVYEGALRIGDKTVPTRNLAVLGPGGAVELHAEAPAKALLLAGAPLGEPIVQYGPFVMNSKAEIEQAIDDFRAGRLA